MVRENLPLVVAMILILPIQTSTAFAFFGDGGGGGGTCCSGESVAPQVISDLFSKSDPKFELATKIQQRLSEKSVTELLILESL